MSGKGENMAEECKGRIYKLSIQFYVDKNENIIEKYQFRKLKKISCSGCEFCGIFDEEISNMDKDRIFHVNKYVDNGLYRLLVTNEHRDWESGQVDDWDVELQLMPEQTTSGSE